MEQILLPIVKGNNSYNVFPSVSIHTVASLMTGIIKPPEERKIIIIDCRFHYEYQGGHIQGAINITGSDKTNQLLRLITNQNTDSRKCILLFHCEFSKNRAPHTMELLRQIDRSMNIWPKVSYDQMYLIQNGYHAFHQTYPALCEPKNAYVPMTTKGFYRPRSRIKSRIQKHSRSLKVRQFSPMLESVNDDNDTNNIDDSFNANRRSLNQNNQNNQ